VLGSVWWLARLAAMSASRAVPEGSWIRLMTRPQVLAGAFGVIRIPAVYLGPSPMSLALATRSATRPLAN